MSRSKYVWYHFAIIIIFVLPFTLWWLLSSDSDDNKMNISAFDKLKICTSFSIFSTVIWFWFNVTLLGSIYTEFWREPLSETFASYITPQEEPIIKDQSKVPEAAGDMLGSSIFYSKSELGEVAKQQVQQDIKDDMFAKGGKRSNILISDDELYQVMSDKDFDIIRNLFPDEEPYGMRLRKIQVSTIIFILNSINKYSRKKLKKIFTDPNQEFHYKNSDKKYNFAYEDVLKIKAEQASQLEQRQNTRRQQLVKIKTNKLLNEQQRVATRYVSNTLQQNELKNPYTILPLDLWFQPEKGATDIFSKKSCSCPVEMQGGPLNYSSLFT
jgi:hypothetical protein